MKTQPALHVDVIILPEGAARAKFGAPAARLPAEVAIVLDGVVQETMRVERHSARDFGFVWPLPRHRLFATLDVLHAETGVSLLPIPISLAAANALVCAAPATNGLRVNGGFTGAAWLADTIGIEFMDGPVQMARGLAHRQAGTQNWAYDCPITVLAHSGRIASPYLRVGGLPIEHVKLSLSPACLGFAGCLDIVTPMRVEGWAIDTKNAGERVLLDVVTGARIVGQVRADLLRDDIRAGGLGDGKCGFGFDLPSPEDARARRQISVRIAGTPTNLTGSPVVIDPRPDLLGRFDTLHGMSAHGWAMDRARPASRVTVEAVGPGGEVLGRSVANGFRGDLLGAGLADGLCAFKIDLSPHFERLIGQDIAVRFANTDVFLAGSPHRIMANGNMQRFLRRREILLRKPEVLPRLKRALSHRTGTVAISIIMPVFNTPRTWLSEALESVRHQFCDAWELICVNDGSTAPHVKDLLASYARSDARVRVLTSPHNVGATKATNFGIRAARHPYILFLDHDDYLEPDAVWQFIRAAQMTDADLMYGDEALTDEHLKGILEFRLRPAFSHDYYLSHPYFVHPICVRTDIARRIGGLNESLHISADVDFVLRMIEESRRITHVPAVLYRWRTHAASAGHARQQDVMAATVGALQRHLNRIGSRATAGDGVWFNQFRIDWPNSDAAILIIIPTKNGHDLLKKAIDSIERTQAGETIKIVVVDHESDDPAAIAYLAELGKRHIVMPYQGPFNFSRMNNHAVKRHGQGCEFVLFMNNDVEATQQGWLNRLRSLANRPDVGAVGPLLMYSDQKVQHAGVIIGFNNSADHALRLQDVFLDDGERRNLGYNCALTSVRDYSAVTAACMMMRRSVFDAAGGFDTKFGIGFNDTDLCLRLKERGLRVLYDGCTVLYHYESATRSLTKQVFHPADTKRMTQRWGRILKDGDPFYNPNLSLHTQDHIPREDPFCRITYRPRALSNVLASVLVDRDVDRGHDRDAAD